MENGKGTTTLEDSNTLTDAEKAANGSGTGQGIDPKSVVQNSVEPEGKVAGTETEPGTFFQSMQENLKSHDVVPHKIQEEQANRGNYKQVGKITHQKGMDTAT